MTGFCTSPRFVEHATSPTHPERPERIMAIARAVREAGLIESPDPFPGFRIQLGAFASPNRKLVELQPRETNESWPGLVHPPAYIERIRHISKIGGGVLDQGDTPIGPTSFEIAMLAISAGVECCDAVVGGRVKRAFAAVRPPGHHAEPDRPMGFCLFANLAIAARYLQKTHGIGKIAIVDFDVHHGNGTQAAFEDDPSVLFISLHQDPRTCYPGSGYATETGIDAGKGFTLNLPFAPGSGDEDYLNVFGARVVPCLESFRPEMLLISAGFDAHRDDPLAQIELSEDAFEQMTRVLVGVADVHCGGRVVSMLEGGYNLRALGRSVVRHLKGLDL
ncbi:MAG TPA: histone deacetylase [Tepidisphaeraceae bacterium]|jgi:acetoin utilization deacetylase AcuC-like enzyme